MRATQRFIEDAIKGGWWKLDYDTEPVDAENYRFFLSSPLLDPLAWQAVGKTRGWKYKSYKEYEWQWQHEWHRFIDHLADGLSIEEALSKTDVTID